MGFLKRIWRAREGAVAIMGAMGLMSMIGMAALAVEAGNGYAVKVSRQRVADVAALSAALAYRTTATQAVLTATAQDIAQAHGLPRASATATLTNSNTRVRVVINSAVPLRLARVLSSNRLTMAIRNTATASLVESTTPGCIMALASAPTSGVTLSGGVSINAQSCTVSTNSGVTTPNGTRINAKEVVAGKAVSNTANITTAPTANNIKQNQGTPVTDPLATDARLTAAFAKLGTVTQPIAPTAPPALTTTSVPTGTDWTLDYNGGTPPTGVTRTTSTSWVAAPGGTYNIRTLAIAGGMTLTFQGASTVTISNNISSNGNGITWGNCTCTFNGNVNANYQTFAFGNGTFIFNGSPTFNGSTSFGNGNVTVVGTANFQNNVTFGAGVHRFGAINSSSGTLTFGAGDFTVVGQMTVSSTTVTVGNGNVWIGGNTSNNIGLTLGGGAKLRMGNGNLTINGSMRLDGGGTEFRMGTGNVYIGRGDDGEGLYTSSGILFQTGGGTYFSVAGRMNISQGTVTLGPADYRIGNVGGTTCATMPNDNCHSIVFGNGNLTFGAGPFSANGNITVSSNGSGNRLVFGATPEHFINGSILDQGPIDFGAGMYFINGRVANTSNGAMTGTNVTLILKDQITLAGSAGFNLQAPTTATVATSGGIADVTIATRTSVASSISAGSNNVLAGTFYTPNSDLTLSGGAGITSGTGCLMYIVRTITLSGGTTAATRCESISGAGSANSIKLIS